MKTYLLTWNPNGWDWENLPDIANRVLAGETVVDRWSCGNTKKIEVGDRIFLIRLGVLPKGIMASGWVLKSPFFDTHWDEEKARSGINALYVECEWERILNPMIDLPIPFSKLQTGKLKSVYWSARASGIEIPILPAEELEMVWANHLGNSSLNTLSSDEELVAIEGEKRVALVRHRKREHKLRAAKIAQFQQQNTGRLFCEVGGCGFNFEKVYGNLGKDFAHVHHLKPLSDRESPSATSLDDLAVVCANCHAMIHRGGKCRPLDKLIP